VAVGASGFGDKAFRRVNLADETTWAFGTDLAVFYNAMHDAGFAAPDWIIFGCWLVDSDGETEIRIVECYGVAIVLDEGT
jgi:hypothetical protein